MLTIPLIAIVAQVVHIHAGRIVIDSSITPRQTLNWEHLGCYEDHADDRVLEVNRFTSDDMTPSVCINFCAANGFYYAGVEFGKECYCDYLRQRKLDVDQSECNMPCIVDNTLLCGSGNRIDIYHDPTKRDPNFIRDIGNWQYQGCFLDSRSARTLNHPITVQDVTPEKCISACHAQGYPLAGLEYSIECWCDKFLQWSNRQSFESCQMTCEGDHSQLCGDKDHVGIYQDMTVEFVEGCLDMSTRWKFKLEAFYHPLDAPEKWFNVKVTPQTNASSPIYVLSACGDTCDGFDDFNVINGHLFPEPRSAHTPIPFGLNPAFSPVFAITGSTVPTIPPSNWCPQMIPNFIAPLYGPPGLAVLGNVDKWAVCTAPNGRNDVIYQPREDVPYAYDFSTCLPVSLLMRFHN